MCPSLIGELLMRLVVAVVRPSQVEMVRQALAGVHVTRLTVCDTQGFDPATAPGQVVQQTILEIAVNEDFVDRTVDTLVTALALGTEDLGTRLFVLPMSEAVQIYRDVRGPEAL
jgi:nitrogen regulatory protein P-II 1